MELEDYKKKCSMMTREIDKLKAKEREDLPDGSHEELKVQLQLSKKKCSMMTREIEKLRTSLSQKKGLEQFHEIINYIMYLNN